MTASGTFVLRPLYGGQKSVRALEVPLGHDRLVLEYRRPEGSLDGRLNGVYAYRVSGDSYRSANPLSPSAGDRDGAVTTPRDAAAKLTVTVGAVGADSATVTVNGVTAPAGAGTAPAVVVPPENPAASAPATPVPDPDGADGADEPSDSDDPTGAPAPEEAGPPPPPAGKAERLPPSRPPRPPAPRSGTATSRRPPNCTTVTVRPSSPTPARMHLGLKEWARADRQAHDPLIATSPFYYGSPSLRFRVD